MIEEVALKTHLIVTDIHEEYDIKWHGKIVDSKPLIKDGMPVFVIIGSGSRAELNTVNIKLIEKCAKQMTNPRGKASCTKDTALIYIKEVDGNEKCIGTVVHKHVKKYAQMYDKVGYR